MQRQAMERQKDIIDKLDEAGVTIVDFLTFSDRPQFRTACTRIARFASGDKPTDPAVIAADIKEMLRVRPCPHLHQNEFGDWYVAGALENALPPSIIREGEEVKKVRKKEDLEVDDPTKDGNEEEGEEGEERVGEEGGEETERNGGKKTKTRRSVSERSAKRPRYCGASASTSDSTAATSPVEGVTAEDLSVPDELLLAIFNSLEVRSLIACSAVNHTWRRVSYDRSPWIRWGAWLLILVITDAEEFSPYNFDYLFWLKTSVHYSHLH